MEPLISILVPVYQAEAYLSRCLDSAINQTYPNVEIILVDDGSSDGGGKIGQQYARSHKNIQYISSEHYGVSQTRQTLLARANGEYIFFLDSDDYIDLKTIEVLYCLLVESAADIAQCRMRLTSGSETEKIVYGDDTIHVYSTFPDMIESWHHDILQCMIAGKLYRRNLFTGISFPVGKIHEDEAVMHRVLQECTRVICTNLQLYYYYQNPMSIMNKPFSYDRYDALDALIDRINFFTDSGMEFEAALMQLRYCLLCIQFYRKTFTEISTKDRNLSKLLEKYISMVHIKPNIDHIP